MSEEPTFTIPAYGYVKKLEMYRLPPFYAITSFPSVAWVLNQAESKKHRKYLAVSMILGQPFIRSRKK